MPYTAEQRKQVALKMYGCDPEKFKQSAEESMTFKWNGAPMVLISMLSDVQEMVERDLKEDARQHINLVKYLISEWVERLTNEGDGQ